MSLSKKDIVTNITAKAQIPLSEGHLLLNFFIEYIKTNSKIGNVKFSKFGTFYCHTTPLRIGRNPKTREEFKIAERTKTILKPSNFVKNFIN